MIKKQLYTLNGSYIPYKPKKSQLYIIPYNGLLFINPKQPGARTFHCSFTVRHQVVIPIGQSKLLHPRSEKQRVYC